MMYFLLSRVSPSTESGQGLSRRHTCAQSSFSASLNPSMLYCLRRSSRIMRCKSSSLVQGISPLRTLSIAGLYPRRQRSVNSAQLILRCLPLPQPVASAITELRQSTTVPKVSKTHAFTLANSGFMFCEPPVVCCARAERISVVTVVAILEPAKPKNTRRLSLGLIRSHLRHKDQSY